MAEDLATSTSMEGPSRYFLHIIIIPITALEIVATDRDPAVVHSDVHFCGDPIEAGYGGRRLEPFGDSEMYAN
jgi:hypothetical protein